MNCPCAKDCRLLGPSRDSYRNPARWSNFAPFLLGLQKRADFTIYATVTVTTNTLSDFYIAPQHQDLIERIFSLSKLGMTMKAIAETLNEEGCTSHTGKPFNSELVGRWYRSTVRRLRVGLIR